MASRLKDIIPLAEDTTKELSRSPADWTAFLTTAARNYKYSFHEQVLIYAQRPKATACAEIDLWNHKFRRWVKRGAKGIALIDDSGDKLRLRYVFDVSDTYSRHGEQVRLWTAQERFKDGIAETLTDHFGSVDESSLPSVLLSTAKNAADDHYMDYLTLLQQQKWGSFLSDLGEDGIRVSFRQLLEDSIAYMLLTRCGYQPMEHLPDASFLQVMQYNTLKTISVLGAATTDVSEMVLREIESTIKTQIREEQRTGQKFAETPKAVHNEVEKRTEEIERSVEHGNHIQTNGRLSAAGTDITDGTAENWEIWQTAEELSEKTPESTLQYTASVGDIDGTSGGNRADSDEQVRRTDSTDRTERGSDGGTESRKSDAVGTTEEQHPSERGGNDSQRPDLQLTPPKGGNDENALPPFLSEELLSELFCYDRYLKSDRSGIVQYFKEHTDVDERAVFMKGLYNDDYTEILVLGGQRIGYKKEDDGLLTWKGSYLTREEESKFSWGLVQEFVNELIERGSFFPVQPLPVLKPEVEQLSLFGMDSNEQEKTKEEEKTESQAPEKAVIEVEDVREIIEEQPVEVRLPEPENPIEPETVQQEKINFRITNDALGAGGQKEKCNHNLAAIRTLQKIEAENRLATPEEQEILSRYVGWGGLPQAFDENNSFWSNEYQQLKNLLTDEEYTSARASTLNAHYTSPVVIRAIYQAIENMGFRRGNILEPACGSGNFFGMLPESMQDSKLFGVELDSITGRIARQLYQKNNIAVCGFEETNLPDSFFDVAVGNVPFGSYQVSDRKYDKHHFLIHDYFFGATRS